MNTFTTPLISTIHEPCTFDDLHFEESDGIETWVASQAEDEYTYLRLGMGAYMLRVSVILKGLHCYWVGVIDGEGEKAVIAIEYTIDMGACLYLPTPV